MEMIHRQQQRTINGGILRQWLVNEKRRKSKRVAVEIS
jgi:hypothetical protein